MGVYIKNMKAPVTCCYCPLIAYDPDIEWNDGGMETQGAYVCVMTHELIDNTKREGHCPLVPIPPHGRLIDADAMLMRINHEGMEAYMDGVCYGVHPSQEYLYLLGEIIDDAPTIIPAELAEEGET